MPLPRDYFAGEEFYLHRQSAIDAKYQQLRTADLCSFMQEQFEKAKGNWTRLLYDGERDMFTYCQSPEVQQFLGKVPPNHFAFIVFKIAQNPTENRRGLPVYVIFNDDEMRMSKVKTMREKVRPEQLTWLEWLTSENIPAEVVRIKKT